MRPSGTGESPLANAKDWLYVDHHGLKVEEIRTQCLSLLVALGIYWIHFKKAI